jgi:hypothetical protein
MRKKHKQKQQRVLALVLSLWGRAGRAGVCPECRTWTGEIFENAFTLLLCKLDHFITINDFSNSTEKGQGQMKKCFIKMSKDN